MIQLFLHLLGDFFLQNDEMAVNKSKYTTHGYLMCTIHCMFYSIPFGLYYHNAGVYGFVFFTHWFIDKFGLAEYVTRTINWNWDKNSLFGFQKDRPHFVTVWIHTIRDNSMHIFCNYLIIKHFIG